MSIHRPIKRIWQHLLDGSRFSLSRPDALLQLSLLGLISGLLAGAVIVVFRYAIEGIQDGMLPGDGPENYEGLPVWARVFLPILGGILLAAMFRYGSQGLHMLGIARVMERLAYHQGYLTARGFVLQFIGAAIAIITGHSVGREGPHVYLGAAAASLFGQYFSLPNNTIRTMVGCGAAAGIAASFNTPLAGVIFALEVLMLEYTLASFMPIILATVSATALSNAVLGTDPAFAVHTMQIGSLAELPVVVLLGIVAGAASAGFVHLLQTFARHSQPVPIWWRTILAGIIVGICGAFLPQVLGIGYDTINAALAGQIGIGLLLLLAVVKIFATSASIGLGIPGGMIGPAFFIGATLGSLVGLAADQLLPNGLGSEVGFYALLGMGGMMAGAMHAPLAALTAMMELTYNPGVIMPGMLVVTAASLTASEVFRKESLFVAMLKSSGRDYNTHPMLQMLRRVGVASAMNENLVQISQNISRDTAEAILYNSPEWLLIDGEDGPERLMPAVDLAVYIKDTAETGKSGDIDLFEIPARRMEVSEILMRSTLQEALEALNRNNIDALYVRCLTSAVDKQIRGILTREMIQATYRY